MLGLRLLDLGTPGLLELSGWLTLHDVENVRTCCREIGLMQMLLGKLRDLHCALWSGWVRFFRGMRWYRMRNDREEEHARMKKARALALASSSSMVV